MKKRLLAAMLALTMAVGLAPVGSAEAYASSLSSGNEAAAEDAAESEIVEEKETETAVEAETDAVSEEEVPAELDAAGDPEDSQYTVSVTLTQEEIVDGIVPMTAMFCLLENGEPATDLNPTYRYSWYHKEWNTETGEQEFVAYENATGTGNGITLHEGQPGQDKDYKVCVEALDVTGAVLATGEAEITVAGDPSKNYFSDWDFMMIDDKNCHWGDTLNMCVRKDYAAAKEENVTYYWYGSVCDSEGNITGWQLIQDADSSAFQPEIGADTPDYYRVLVCYHGGTELQYTYWDQQICASSIFIDAPNNSVYTVQSGQSITLHVSADTAREDAELTYLWEYSNESTGDSWCTIDGEDSSDCQVPAWVLTDESNKIRCTVGDGGCTDSLTFTINVNSLPDCEEYLFDYRNNELTLSVSPVSGDEFDTYSYQWKVYNKNTDEYEVLDNYKDSSVTISSWYSGEELYYCEITDGTASWTEEFHVRWADTLSVVRADRSQTGQSSIRMSVAAATSSERGTILYQWQYLGDDGDYYDIDGATDPVLTVDVKDLVITNSSFYSYLAYRCKVTDGINTVYEDFDGNTYSGDRYEPFILELEGAAYQSGYGYYYQDARIGDTVSVKAESCLDDEITYLWEYDKSGYQEIKESGAALTLQEAWFDGAGKAELYCTVSQGRFKEKIRIDVSLCSEETPIRVDDDVVYVTILQGEKVTLSADAVSSKGKELTYTWYDNTDYKLQEIEGEKGASLTVDTAEKDIVSDYYKSYYMVTVSDGTYTRNIWYYLMSEEMHYMSEYDTTIGQHVLLGESLTLKAAELSEVSADISYQWYNWVSSEEEGMLMEAVEGADSSTYSIIADTLGNSFYECREFWVDSEGRHCYCSTLWSVYAEDTCYSLTTDQVTTLPQDSYTRTFAALSFTPSADGIYTIETLNAQSTQLNSDNKRMYLYRLVDGHLKLVDRTTVSWTVDGDIQWYEIRDPEPNLRMQCELKAGETYYVKLMAEDIIDCTAVQFLVRNDTEALYTDYVETGLAEKAMLEVPDSLVSDGDTFRWYLLDGNSYRIVGSADQTYQACAADTGSDNTLVCYRCVVDKTDGSTISLDYTVKYSDIRVPDEARTGRVCLPFSPHAGEAVRIDADSESIQGRELTYIWNYDAMTGLKVTTDGSVCTVNVTEELPADRISYNYQIICTVDDGYSTRSIIYTLVDTDRTNSDYGGGDWDEFDDGSELQWTASLAEDTCTYDGTAQTPSPVVTDGMGNVLTEGTDYTVTYADNTNVGTATYTVTGQGKYSGTVSGTFTIVPASIAQAVVTPAEKICSYDNTYHMPDVTVTLDGKKLTGGTDYMTEYDSNKNVGTAVITIVGKGNYTGMALGSFRIIYSCETPAITKVENTTTGMKVTWGAVSGAKLYRVFVKLNGKWCKLADTASTSYSFSMIGKAALVSGTTYTYTVRCMDSAKSYYTSDFDAAGKSYCYLSTIKPTVQNVSTGMKISWAKVTGAAGYIVYRKTGSAGYARVQTITKGTTLTWTDEAVKSKNGTQYTYAVRAYYGSSYGYFTPVAYLRLTAPVISSLTNVSGKKMAVKWVKNTAATGYVVQYSLSSTFASGNKTVTITKNSTVTAKISSLKKGKTYYVRVCAYKTVGTAKYYSCWSARAQVKIKK